MNIETAIKSLFIICTMILNPIIASAEGTSIIIDNNQYSDYFSLEVKPFHTEVDDSSAESITIYSDLSTDNTTTDSWIEINIQPSDGWHFLGTTPTSSKQYNIENKESINISIEKDNDNDNEYKVKVKDNNEDELQSGGDGFTFQLINSDNIEVEATYIDNNNEEHTFYFNSLNDVCSTIKDYNYNYNYIKLCKDVEISKTLEINSDCCIELGEHTITGNSITNIIKISNHAVTFKASPNGRITCTNESTDSSCITIGINSSLTITDGYYEAHNNIITNNGKLTINNGKFESSNTIINQGNLTICNGEFLGAISCKKSDEEGAPNPKITIYDGNFFNNENPIINSSTDVTHNLYGGTYHNQIINIEGSTELIIDNGYKIINNTTEETYYNLLAKYEIEPGISDGAYIIKYDNSAAISDLVATVTDPNGNTISFDNLNAAFIEAQNIDGPTTIKLQGGVDLLNSIEIYKGDITLDLNGKIIKPKFTGENLIYLKCASLTITDSGDNGELGSIYGVFDDINNNSYVTTNTFYVEDANITIFDGKYNGKTILNITQSSTSIPTSANIYGGEFETALNKDADGSNAKNCYCINNSYANVNLYGGKFKSVTKSYNFNGEQYTGNGNAIYNCQNNKGTQVSANGSSTSGKKYDDDDLFNILPKGYHFNIIINKNDALKTNEEIYAMQGSNILLYNDSLNNKLEIVRDFDIEKNSAHLAVHSSETDSHYSYKILNSEGKELEIGTFSEDGVLQDGSTLSTGDKITIELTANDGYYFYIKEDSEIHVNTETPESITLERDVVVDFNDTFYEPDCIEQCVIPYRVKTILPIGEDNQNKIKINQENCQNVYINNNIIYTEIGATDTKITLKCNPGYYFTNLEQETGGSKKTSYEFNLNGITTDNENITELESISKLEGTIVDDASLFVKYQYEYKDFDFAISPYDVDVTIELDENIQLPENTEWEIKTENKEKITIIDNKFKAPYGSTLIIDLVSTKDNFKVQGFIPQQIMLHLDNFVSHNDDDTYSYKCTFITELFNNVANVQYIFDIVDIKSLKETFTSINNDPNNYNNSIINLKANVELPQSEVNIDENNIIDLSDVTSYNLGTHDTPFNGTINGNGYAIQNFLAQSTDSSTSIFGTLGDSAKINNLVVSGKFFVSKLLGGNKDATQIDTLDIPLFLDNNKGQVKGLSFIGQVYIDEDIIKNSGAKEVALNWVGNNEEGAEFSNSFIYFTDDSEGEIKSATTGDNKVCVVLKQNMRVGKGKGRTYKVCSGPKSKTEKANNKSYVINQDIAANDSIRECDADEFANGSAAYWLNYDGKGYTGAYNKIWSQGKEYPVLATEKNKYLVKLLYVVNDEKYADSFAAPYFANVGTEATISYTTQPESITVNGVEIANIGNISTPMGKSEQSFIVPETAVEKGIVTVMLNFLEETAIALNSNDDAHIAVAGNRIIFSNAAGQNINLYDLAGHCLVSEQAPSYKVTIIVPENGIYIAKAGNKTEKVVVR